MPLPLELRVNLGLNCVYKCAIKENHCVWAQPIAMIELRMGAAHSSETNAYCAAGTIAIVLQILYKTACYIHIKNTGHRGLEPQKYCR